MNVTWLPFVLVPGLRIFVLGLAKLDKVVWNVDRKVEERIVLLGRRLTGQAVDL